MTDDLERRLRQELSRRAEQAPRDPALAEQIISTARTQAYSPHRRHGWSTWTLPLIAAAGVAAIVTGVFVGVAQLRDSADGPKPPLVSVGNSHSASPSVATPTPTTKPAPSTGAVSTQTKRPTTNAVPHNAVGLDSFTASDLTFYGESDGWALGTANCLVGSGLCPAMVRTTDAGAHWTSMPQPPGDTGEILGVRFATDLIGYAYGPSRLEMTVNGGKSWTTQSGGAAALETYNGNVIRAEVHGRAVNVQYADVGSSTWTTVALPDQPTVASVVSLVRSDSDAYLLLSSAAGPALYRSIDNGTQWSAVTTSCPDRSGHALVPAAIAASPGGRVNVVCKYATGDSMLLSGSPDAGSSFTYAASAVPLDAGALIAGDPRTTLVTVGNKAYRSTSGGDSWADVTDVAGTATFVGFESTTLGRIVTDGGRTIWTTTDAGVHWSAFTFPS